MKLLIPTLGTRGDVQPYLALAQGLATAGHEVLLATHPSMGELVRAHGVPFAPIGPDVDIGLEAARIRGNSRHWLLGMKRTMDFALRITGEAHQELLALCKLNRG